MYFETSYITKYYFPEPHSEAVRELVRKADVIRSSLWALAEFQSAIHRKVLEGVIRRDQAHAIASLFSEHIADGLWTLAPVTESLLRHTGDLLIAAPADLYIRTADAVHLVTALRLGELEVWTSDRHMLAAAPYFGLKGRSVESPIETPKPRP